MGHTSPSSPSQVTTPTSATPTQTDRLSQTDPIDSKVTAPEITYLMGA